MVENYENKLLTIDQREKKKKKQVKGQFQNSVCTNPFTLRVVPKA